MNRLRIKGAWNEMKGNFRQRSANQTGNPESFAQGTGERLTGRSQRGLGRMQDRIRRMFGNP